MSTEPEEGLTHSSNISEMDDREKMAKQKVLSGLLSSIAIDRKYKKNSVSNLISESNNEENNTFDEDLENQSNYVINESSFIPLSDQAINVEVDTAAELSRKNSKEKLIHCSKKCFYKQLPNMASYVIRCMSNFGVCVIDNLLGESAAKEALKEVKYLENQKAFVAGKVTGGIHEKARGDFVCYINGNEPFLDGITHFLHCVDCLVHSVSKLYPFNQHRIRNRTQAMVAYYPGKGTGYLKHVDNPCEDGRCLTCIYYLNEDWDPAVDGGCLKLYPSWTSDVVTVEPIIDRFVLFWSDRRNPHEVEPCYGDRYAISVWFYDSDEVARDQLSKKSQSCSLSDSSNETTDSNPSDKKKQS